MSRHTNLLKSLLSPAITQRASPAVNLRVMIQELKETDDENNRLLDENEQLRVRNYELKRELEEAYRKLCKQTRHVALDSPLFASTIIVLRSYQFRLQHQNPKHHLLIHHGSRRRNTTDLINLLNEKNIALTETKVAAAQSAEAVNMVIDENIQLKAEVQRLQEEIKELRAKLWDATVEELKIDAGRIDESYLATFASESPT
ncbi:hypothetical protein E4T47_07149 [Aureobasidium subglaciale]|nr:hypothetical protein E4T47_07149 [Aureobasidium subglaciale]